MKNSEDDTNQEVPEVAQETYEVSQKDHEIAQETPAKPKAFSLFRVEKIIEELWQAVNRGEYGQIVKVENALDIKHD
jgi:hypothetical protein